MAPPVSALPPPEVIVRREPPNQTLTFVLAFFAVVGVGAAVILAVMPPPGRQRIITIETPVERIVERVVEKRVPVLIQAPDKRRPHSTTIAKGPPLPMPDSKACGDDPLCGIDLRR